jgi:O-antigen ligase
VFQKAIIRTSFFYLISVSFILLNLFFMVKRNQVLINALPLFFAVILLAIYSFDKIFYLVVMLTPLSVPLSELVPGLSFDMFLPTEPLLFGLLVIFMLKVIYERQFDKDLLKHPVSIVIYINLAWIFITAVTSVMPLVSFKFWLSRIWFVAGFYFLAGKLFTDRKNMEKHVWLYAGALVVVIFYATYRHLGYGLYDKQAAHFVMTPFYNDHTSYGAVLAMYIPFLTLFTFGSSYSRKSKIIAFFVLSVLFLGFILSYSRAAWLSIIVASGVYVVVKLKIRFKPLFITFIAILTLFFLFQNRIFMMMEQNSEQSSADFRTHISSVSNITTDASNLERINRWNCAVQMFSDKPIFGFGPGTYMFKYAPYQQKENRTIISTNSADGGNAHSEYLGPLAESGLFGMLSYLLIIGFVVYTAVHAYTRLNEKRLKSLVLAALISLTTYYFHGFLNNFLDTDKISAPFWGFTAIIVALDIYSRKQQKLAQKNPD